MWNLQYNACILVCEIYSMCFSVWNLQYGQVLVLLVVLCSFHEFSNQMIRKYTGFKIYITTFHGWLISIVLLLKNDDNYEIKSHKHASFFSSYQKWMPGDIYWCVFLFNRRKKKMSYGETVSFENPQYGSRVQVCM